MPRRTPDEIPEAVSQALPEAAPAATPAPTTRIDAPSKDVDAHSTALAWAFRCLLLLALLSVALLWTHAALLYPALPDRIPTHFDAAGTPDRWAARSPANWFLLPSLAVVIVALFLSIAWWGRALVVRAPGIVNMPYKRLFLRLSPDARIRVFEPTRVFLALFALLLTVLFWYLLEGTSAVALGRRAQLPSWPVFAFVGTVLLALVPYYLATARRILGEARREGLEY